MPNADELFGPLQTGERLLDGHGVLDIIAADRDALAAIPARYADPPAASLSKLPKSTSKNNEKGRCSECGGFHGLPAVHLDYMGHADVTLALIDLDPLWDIEPAAIDPMTGGPIIVHEGNRLVSWWRLTILGKTRLCVGTCELGKPEPEKELIGDALRNGAMRFGIGTTLWSKAGGGEADPFADGDTGGYERRQAPAPRGRRSEGRSGARSGTHEHGNVSDPPYVVALAQRIDKGVAYVLTIARSVAKGHEMPEPRSTAAITPELCALVADKLNVLPRDIGLQGSDTEPPVSG